MVSITAIALENLLHSLRRETLASNSARTKYSWGLVFFNLKFHRACQATAKDQTSGSSKLSSTVKSKLTASSTLMPGTYLAMQEKMEAPTPLFPGQCTRAWTKSSCSLPGHPWNLQKGVTVGLVLDSLSWVTRVLWSRLNRKLVFSGPSPGNLAFFQHSSQLVWGLFSSALHGMYPMLPSSFISIVHWFSIRWI